MLDQFLSLWSCLVFFNSEHNAEYKDLVNESCSKYLGFLGFEYGDSIISDVASRRFYSPAAAFCSARAKFIASAQHQCLPTTIWRFWLEKGVAEPKRLPSTNGSFRQGATKVLAYVLGKRNLTWIMQDMRDVLKIGSIFGKRCSNTCAQWLLLFARRWRRRHF